jgi:transposase-like protein
VKSIPQEIVGKQEGQIQDLDTRVELIQALIPLGLLRVQETLEDEVKALAGAWYARKGERFEQVRWGRQPGSVYLRDQKLPVVVPRVRARKGGPEVPLRSYQLLQKPFREDEGVLRRILRGLSCRDYRTCAEAVPQAFGLSSSTLSRRYLRASVRKLRQLCERKLGGYDFVVLFLDGKSFQEDEIVVALGVTLQGQKVILGFVQTATENEGVVKEFLQGLLERGFVAGPGLLCVLDGSKGLRKAVLKALPGAAIQRCQWHKRENVVRYLPKSQQPLFRQKLQRAYQQPEYPQAKEALGRIRQELQGLNESAVRSLDEGLEETLTLHRLGVFAKLGESLKTTNCIESLFAQVSQWTRKVDRWRNSSQKQRWAAAALLEIEPRLRRVKGYRYLPQLRAALLSRKEVVSLEAA